MTIEALRMSSMLSDSQGATQRVATGSGSENFCRTYGIARNCQPTVRRRQRSSVAGMKCRRTYSTAGCCYPFGRPHQVNRPQWRAGPPPIIGPALLRPAPRGQPPAPRPGDRRARRHIAEPPKMLQAVHAHPVLCVVHPHRGRLVAASARGDRSRSWTEKAERTGSGPGLELLLAQQSCVPVHVSELARRPPIRTGGNKK